MIVGAILAVISYSLLFLFRTETRLMVTSISISKKQELAGIGLEHARYKLQSGNNWYNLPIGGFEYDREYTIPHLGKYTVYIMEGNLFKAGTAERQGASEFRTIGVKVKVTNTEMEHSYYGVVKKVGYGGPLISKGKIDLPCNDAAITAARYNFYWGDIYSASTKDGYCRIPYIPVGIGASAPQPWGPAVYARASIYTALGRSGSSYVFGETYDDMSPTAKCHPYSSFAKAPSLALDMYKKLAKDNGAYYGPQFIGGSGDANPYYINDGVHDLSDLVPHLFPQKLSMTSNVMFIDTTDGLPLRIPGNASTPTNTYCGTTFVSSTTLAVYQNDAQQFNTVGALLVMGPLVLKGDDPGPEAPSGAGQVDPLLDYWPSKIGLWPPDNFYYPQSSDGAHFSGSAGGKAHQNRMDNIKHAGFLYCAAELRIGGPRCTTGCICENNTSPEPVKLASINLREPSFAQINNSIFGPSAVYAASGPKPKDTDTPVPGTTPVSTPTPAGTPTMNPSCSVQTKNCGGGSGSLPLSDICIYGTVFLDEHASLTIDTLTDCPKLYIYYNQNANSFASMGSNVIVLSFSELSFLVPTPAPRYPSF